MNELSARSSGAAAAFLSGGGEMAAMIRATDWSRTGLGPIESWPESLRTAVSLSLASNFPINLIWGPEHRQIYNDGYRVVCGDAHPAALGESYTKTWASAWPAIGGPFERALTGETSYLENQRMFLFRNGYLEETFFTFSLSPIRDEAGRVGGVFHPVTETTASALAERRASMLRDLNARLADARATSEVYARALAHCHGHAADLPFVLIYGLNSEGDAYHLAGCSGMEPSGLPRVLAPDDTAILPMPELCAARGALRLEPIAGWCGGGACGPYEEAPSAAFAFALTLPGGAQPAALLIAGISPRLPLNQPYADFYSLVAASVSAGLANARTYEEERRQADLLAAVDRAKTAFFANVSHEFRTPLTLMLGPLQDALDDSADLPFAQRDRLNTAQRNAQRLLKLVNSLLEFSRLEAGRARAMFEPTDLAALTADLASSFRSACERAGLFLVVTCGQPSQRVYVDRDMWEKIVLNLVSNAFKFTLQGGIRVTLDEVPGGVELIVGDTGTGIDAAHVNLVFERFHRVENVAGRTHEGSGIGLSLVAELVKLHGGDVSVQSRVGEGSSFRVRMRFGMQHLPADQVVMRAAPLAVPAPTNMFVSEALRWLPDSGWTRSQEQAVAPMEGRPRVVLADDNADMRHYVTRLLEEGGYAVTPVADGQAVLEATECELPDLVLSDVMMPGLDGFGLLAALRGDARRKDLLVILLSARAGEEARLEGLAAGADDYLLKPFSARELRARVDGAVKLARQRRDAAAREADLRAEIVAAEGRAALLQTEADLAFALQAARMGSWTIDVATRTPVCSEYCLDLFGVRHESDISIARYQELLHPDDVFNWQVAFDRAVNKDCELDTEYRIIRPDGQVRWLLTRGRAAFEDGRAVQLAGVTMDITERKAAEESQRLLLDELNHRVKNTLAVVQSIAMLTVLGDGASPGPNDNFIGRIHALGRAHDLLTEAKWQGASLVDVIQRTLELFSGEAGPSQIAVSGPMVSLGSNAAVTLHMAFHELAINAVKYGGLSTQEGRVDIVWRAATEGGRNVIDIDWQESGGPPVRTPTRRGFGCSLIEKGLVREMNGQAELVFLPGGLHCHMRLPLSAKLRLAA